MLAAALSVLLSACVFVQPCRAQIGSDCSDTEPCPGNQECTLGYCRCPQGFVKTGRECLPERSFNETCLFDDQCVDYRLKCGPEGLCTCIKYFHWDEYSKQCLTYKDLKYMLNDMEEKHHTLGELNLETNAVFTGMMWTGLAVMVIGFVFAFGCVFYGCCIEWLCCCRGDKLSKSRLPPQPTCRVQGSTSQGQTQRQANQGGGVDYIPAFYETTSFDVI